MTSPLHVCDLVVKRAERRKEGRRRKRKGLWWQQAATMSRRPRREKEENVARGRKERHSASGLVSIKAPYNSNDTAIPCAMPPTPALLFVPFTLSRVCCCSLHFLFFSPVLFFSSLVILSLSLCVLLSLSFPPVHHSLPFLLFPSLLFSSLLFSSLPFSSLPSFLPSFHPSPDKVPDPVCSCPSPLHNSQPLGLSLNGIPLFSSLLFSTAQHSFIRSFRLLISLALNLSPLTSLSPNLNVRTLWQQPSCCQALPQPSDIARLCQVSCPALGQPRNLQLHLSESLPPLPLPYLQVPLRSSGPLY